MSPNPLNGYTIGEIDEISDRVEELCGVVQEFSVACLGYNQRGNLHLDGTRDPPPYRVKEALEIFEGQVRVLRRG
jgi:hypothetical protein